MQHFPGSRARTCGAAQRARPIFSRKRTKPNITPSAKRGVERHVRRFVEWTEERAREWFIGTVNAARDEALTGIVHWQIGDGLRKRLHAMLGAGEHTPNLLASNMAARVAAGCSFVAWVLEMHAEHPSRHFYHVTLMDDRLRTLDRITRIDLTRLGKPVRALLRENGIHDWFGTIELQPYVNWKKGEGRDIAPHIHVIFWSDQPLDTTQLETKLAGSKRLKSFSGAPTVRVTYRKGVGELAHMAAYLFKGPDRGANWVDEPYRRSGRSSTYDAAMRPDQAVRVMEILSHVKLSALLLSSGEGLAGRRQIMNDLQLFRARGDRRQELKCRNVPRIWRRAREQAGKTVYQPVEIL